MLSCFTRNVGYPGYLGMGCEHDGIELRHQFFTLGESQSQNYVGGRVDALVRNQAMRSYMLTSTTPSNLVCPPGIETEPTGMRNASTFSTFGVNLDEVEWESERFLVMLSWFASVSDAPEGRGFVFLRDGGV
jgi:hypothetical protein